MMSLLLKLWNIGRALHKLGALEALIGVAEAARDGDAAKVRARAEALAMLAAYKASYRV
jgi:hypothetical protein